MKRKLYNPIVKCISFNPLDIINPIITLFTGAAQADASVYAANKAYQATKLAAEHSYAGQVAANQANIDIANKTNAANRIIASETNEANRKLAEQQNQWNIEQWNRQNQYNSPANQMKLYKEAGLNPVLAQGDFTPAQQLQSAELANQQIGNPMQAAHVENPAGQSSQIYANGMIAAAEMRKDYVRNMVETAKLGAELIKQNVENGFLPKLRKNEVAIGAKNIEKVTFDIKRGKDLLPYEINNAFQQFCVMKAQEYLYKGQEWYNKELAQAQANTNSLWEMQKDAFAKMPAAQLDKINHDIAVISEQIEMLQNSNQFTKLHGVDMSTYAQKYAADMGYRSTQYSSDKSYSLGVQGIQSNREMFNAKQRQDWRKFGKEIAIQKYLQKQHNLNSLQVAGIMAGASIANGIMNNITGGLDSKRRYKLGQMNYEQTMKRYENNPADAWLNYYNTTGSIPLR